MVQQLDLFCPMRDGARLCFDMYSPADGAPHPVILMRTPYGKANERKDPIYGQYQTITDAGYHVVIQDCRGTGMSEGVLHCDCRSEFPDGYDTVEWLAQQPFCDGSVGMFGLSYNGFDQMAAGVAAPPHLKAICPFMTQVIPPYGMSIRQTIGSYHLFWVYGQLLRELEKHIPDAGQRARLEPILREKLAHLEECCFSLPMNQNPAAVIPGVSMFEEYLNVVNNVENEAYWKANGYPLAVDRLTCAVFHATGWFDGMKDTTVDNYQLVRDHGSAFAKAHNRLLIGPWSHGDTMEAHYDGFDFGQANTGEAQDVLGQMLRWFDCYLRSARNGGMSEPPVRYYVMVADKWLETSDWPPPEARDLPLYLSAGGSLKSRAEDSPPDTYRYDPQQPMPSGLKDSQGRFLIPDWSEMPLHDGILVYQTEPLEAPVTLAGTLRLTLFASTDAPDTDFSCRVVDVDEAGFEFELAAGLVRAKYRDGVLFQKRPIQPGKVEQYEIVAGNTARQLSAGHRLKLYVSSALYPAHDRNLNTGAQAGQTDTWNVACQTVYHSTAYPSCLHLPVLPEEKER